jgi:hypothetical protein
MMSDKLHGFKPGEKVWIMSFQKANEFVAAVIAPADRQLAYQAKANYESDKVVITRSATGVIGTAVWHEFIFHSTESFLSYRKRLAVRSRAEAKVRALCADEGLVWGGKRCSETEAWAAYEKIAMTCDESRKALALEQPNAR